MSATGELDLLAFLKGHHLELERFLTGLELDGAVGEPIWERALLGPAREFLRRPGKRFRARLVASSWALCGRDPSELAPEIPLAVELLHAGSLIVDDIQDDSAKRRGVPSLHRLYGVPVALNTGNWLYFCALELLARSMPATAGNELFRRTGLALMRCHQGQALDIATRVHELPQHQVYAAVHTCTALKTGALMELAAYLGASAAQADEVRCRALARFGYLLGIALQRLDDVGGLLAPRRRDKVIEDLSMARLTWPWAWLARDLEPEEYERWRARGRAIFDARDDGDGHREAGGLAEELAEAVAEMGRSESSRHLRDAFQQLRDALGASPALDEVAQEIERLEKSYV